MPSVLPQGVAAKSGHWVGGLPVGKDGRVRTNYTHNPSTLRLSSVNPNLQNIPRAAGKDLSARVKALFAAEPGCWLLEVDYAAIEAVLVGYFAKSPSYIRLAKLGVHDYLNSHILFNDGKIGQPADLTWSNIDLKAFFKDLKARFEVERDIAKKIVHLCVTGDHEVLTPEGWLPLASLPDGQAVAQWDPATRALSFVVPSRVTREWTEGPLLHLEGRALSALCTPEHRWLVEDGKGSQAWRRAERLPRTGRIPVTGVLEGTTPYSPALAVALSLQADGHITPSAAVWSLVKLRKITRLRTLLHAAGIPFTEKHYGRVKRFRVHLPPAVTQWFTGPLKAKIFDLSRFLTLTSDAKRQGLAEALEWDGHQARNGQRRRDTYFSMRQANAEVMQLLAHTSGRQALLRQLPGSGMWEVSFNRRTRTRLEHLTTREWQQSPTPTAVYCVTVPTGAFLLRRRHRVWVSGNSNYGGSAIKIQGMHPELFAKVENAQRLQRLYFDVCPDVWTWQRHTVALADKQGWLRNPYDYVHRFWKVQNWTQREGDWFPTWGDDAKAALAFLPQSTAAGIIKEAILRLWYEHPAEIGQVLRLQVHDSLVAMIPKAQWDTIAPSIWETMKEPIPQLPLPPEWDMGEFLVVNVEAKQGEKWKGMRVVA